MSDTTADLAAELERGKPEWPADMAVGEYEAAYIAQAVLASGVLDRIRADAWDAACAEEEGLRAATCHCPHTDVRRYNPYRVVSDG